MDGQGHILPGRTWWRGDAGYEQVRLNLVWNGYKPARYPAVIVAPSNAAEVADAVNYARHHGLKVKARSGGHNWTASFLRDDSMVVDLAALNDILIDPERRTASVGPAVDGGQLQRALMQHDLFFPTGHCSDVALGGYLLQGGWGWNVPRLGLANGLLEAIEIVTAAGQVITASALENADYFWAAKGAGAGFFGIITRYHLRLTPRPVLAVNQWLFARDDVPAMLEWAMGIAPSLPHEVELNVFMTPGLAAMRPGGMALVNMACFAASGHRAETILRTLDTCPIRERALLARIAEPATIAELYDLLDGIYVKGLRFGADNMFTDASPERLITCILTMLEDIPTLQSHVLWHPYPIERVLTDNSMAVMATNYLVGYGACEDSVDDARVQSWATSHMRRFEPLAVGMQLGDENLASRPEAPILKPGAEARLEILRAKHDRDGLFHSYYLGAEGRQRPIEQHALTKDV